MLVSSARLSTRAQLIAASSRPGNLQSLRTKLRLWSRVTMGEGTGAQAPEAASKSVNRSYAERMLKFINYAWTPYHAVGVALILASASGTCSHALMSWKLLVKQQSWSLLTKPAPHGQNSFSRPGGR
jgi:hypothetical protein